MDENKTVRASRAFRVGLKKHLPLWREEGLIQAEQAEALSGRYELASLKEESRTLLSMTLYLFGAALIAAAVISIVAAHWDEINRWVKVGLLVSAMLGVEIAGFSLWKIQGKWEKLGHGLMVLGVLLIGANIGLFAQIFHISSEAGGIFLLWAIGSLVMGYAVFSWPMGVLACLLMVIWGSIQAGNHNSDALVLGMYGSIVLIPLAYFTRSSTLFVFSILSVGLIVAMSVGDRDGDYFLPAVILAGNMLFAWGMSHRGRFKKFAYPSLFLASMVLVFLLFLSSFEDVLEDIEGEITFGQEGFFPILPMLGAMLLACVTGYVRSFFERPWSVRQYTAICLIAASLFVLLAGVLAESMLACLVGINLMLCVLAAYWIAQGFRQDRRELFWSGLLLATAMALGRFFEYDTNLTVKGIAFAICGVLVIYAGVKFERNLIQRRSRHGQA